MERILSGETDFTDETFEGAAAAKGDLSDRRFENCIFNGCDFSEASLRGASFIDCKFNDCNLSNAQLTNATLRDSRFADSKLVGLNWASARTVAHLHCERSVLNYGVFESLDLRQSSLFDCTARDADFSRTNLTGANLRGTDLAGARFAETNLTKADLRGATGYLIHPTENKVKGAKFALPEAVALLHAMGLDVS